MTALALTGLSVACSHGAKQAPGTSKGALTGSTFEIDTQGPPLVLEANFVHLVNGTDWDNLPTSAEFKLALDEETGADDDSLAGGVKEDTDQPATTTGSIPNNKDDLTRFFVADEFLGGEAFLYLGFTRNNEGGSANQIFEFNRARPVAPAKFAARTEGDLLIAFDWAGGGNKPVIGIHRWRTGTGGGAPATVCEAANKFPCWSKRADLNPQHYEASVNNGNTPAYSCDIVRRAGYTGQHPDRFGCAEAGETVNIGTLRFGEAAINLTKSGIIPAGSCDSFGSAWLRSRSSTSFSSQSKDYIAPIPIDLNPCKYKVITFVCNQQDDTLHSAQVTLGGETKLSATSVPSGIDEATLCGLGADAGAVFPDKAVGTQAGSVCITKDGGACPSGDAGADGGP